MSSGDEMLKEDVENKSIKHHSERLKAETLVRNSLLAKTVLGDIEIFFSFKKESFIGIEIGNDASILKTIRQLGRIEPLICLLENWLTVPLDFLPVQQNVASGDRIKVNLSMRLTDLNDDEVKAILYLPLEAIQRLNPPNPELMKLMQWGALPCSIYVADVVIEDIQLDKLDVGGMVLLPASFESFWRCKVLINKNSPPNFSAELDANHQRLIFDLYISTDYESKSVQQLTDDSELVQVVLFRLMTIPLDLLLGWTEHPVYIFEQTLSSFTVVLVSEQERIAYGSLVPVGNGYGVLIKNIVGEL